jgi:hypothetical protein
VGTAIQRSARGSPAAKAAMSQRSNLDAGCEKKGSPRCSYFVSPSYVCILSRQMLAVTSGTPWFVVCFGNRQRPTAGTRRVADACATQALTRPDSTSFPPCRLRRYGAFMEQSGRDLWQPITNAAASETAQAREKPLPWVATGCDRVRMVRRVDGSSSSEGSAKAPEISAFRSNDVAESPACGRYGAVYGALRSTNAGP